MRLGVPQERGEGETRVALVPEVVKRLVGKGLEVRVQPGAGARALIPDSAFAEAGAELSDDVWGADVVLKVAPPSGEEIAKLGSGSVLVGFLNPLGAPQNAKALAEAGATAFAVEAIPRISRAQSMDALSSQSNVSGLKSVILAAEVLPRFFPMLMTAAGTIPAANVFIMGAGVAGLQAIATARRLGGRVSATDVRPAAKEEIKSLGASFVGYEDEESKAAQTAGGYAKQLSPEFYVKQAEVVASHIAKQDIVVTTALVQGRKAPTLVSADMVRSMKPGSIIVDIASDSGGNVALTKPGEAVTTENGVKILGYGNWPGRIAGASSALYARNLLTFLTTFWDKEGKKPNLVPDDEIVKGVALTRGGAVVHPSFAAA